MNGENIEPIGGQERVESDLQDNVAPDRMVH
jgi:hypothetical protein